MFRYTLKIVLSFIVMLGLFSLAFHSARKILYDIHISAGAEYEEKGDIIEAIKYLEKAASYTFSQSSVYARIGDVAIREFDAIIANNKESKLGKEASLEIAIKNFMTSLKHNSKNPWAWSGLAEYFERKSYLVDKPDMINVSKLAYGDLGKLDYEDWMAISSVKKAIEIEPANHFYYDLLGFMLMENNLSEQALENYERALALVPATEEHFFIPEQSVPQDIYDAVEKGLKSALKTSELSAKAKIYNELGNWLYYQRKLEPARDYFQMAKEHGYDGYIISGRLGIISYMQRDKDKSLDYLYESIKGDHNKAYEIYLIGQIFCEKGDHEKALNYFKQAKNNAKKNISKQRYLFVIGREYEHLQDLSRAETSYLEALKMNPQSSAYMKVVEFYQRTGMPEKAEEFSIHINADDQ